VQKSEATLLALGRTPATVHDQAISHIYQVYRQQAAILAYNNIFQYAALLAFLVVPLCFFVSSKKARGGGGGGH
jgi:DHA2 family multidrug resistance protein